MSNRIKSLSESPCYQCGVQKDCIEKIHRCRCLQEIFDSVFAKADYDFHNCSMYNVIMMEKRYAKEKAN